MGFIILKIDEEAKHQKHIYWHYTSNFPFASAIVNVWNGKEFDWAVYWGGGPSAREEDCVSAVMENGNKVSKEWAESFFPDLKHIPYRE